MGETCHRRPKRKRGKCHRFWRYILKRYASVITRNPWIVLVLTIAVVTWAGLNSFIKELGAKPLPDFSMPAKGFEPRGTLISRRIVAYNNLDSTIFGIPPLATSSRRRDTSSYTGLTSRSQVCSLDPRSYLSAKTVYGRKDGKTLLNAKTLRTICELEADIIRRNEMFEGHCVRPTNSSLDCCPSLSIGTFVAITSNRSSCLSITDKDVAGFTSLLQTCKKHLDDGSLHERCAFVPSSCATVPSQCLAWNIPLLVFNYMGDKNFALNFGNDTKKLSYTVAFSPLRETPRMFLEKIYEKHLSDLSKAGRDGVDVVAYEFTGMKNIIYDKRLLVDIWYVLSAMILVVFLMWMYSGSIVLSLMGFTTVIFALVLSYWIYSIVFQLRFFPFLNIMTAIFIVGIGADDVFVYVLAWRHARQKIPQSDLEFRASLQTVTCWTEYALEHAAAAMFVTSFTTATAFYAGVSSDITALQCFSIFAGTSIMTNYLLMLTWFPAIMVMHQKYFSPIWCSYPRVADALPGIALAKRTTDGVNTIRSSIITVREKLKGISDTIFGYWIANLVVRLRYVWVAFFFVLAGLGIICMTVYPKLQLPTSQMFPLFIHRHPLEQYDFKIKEKLQIDTSLGSARADFPLIFVWGVIDVDKGYFLDPDNTGSSVWDSSFDLMSKESQEWALKFCKLLKNQTFYKSGKCFMEEFHKFAQQNCTVVQPRKCCGFNPPLKKVEFQTCSKEYVATLAKRRELSPIKLDFEGNVRLMMLRFRSSYPYQFRFSPVDTFWNDVLDWANSQIKNAPSGLRKGWVISDLYFYDLQQSLADGTIKTIGISIGISAMVLLITTQNVIVTLFAVMTISGIIAVTIGGLVLSGWKLNILESMTMSVAVGLSIDFTLHYGVAYFLCRDSKNRKDRVHYSLWHVGSAVAMGTVTTFLAGLVMMPSVIYAYIQIGHFLMLVMSTSWFYATFFFLSLTSLLGPQGAVGDIIRCWGGNKVEMDEKELQEEEEEEDIYMDIKQLKRRRHKSRFFEYEQPDPKRCARARSTYYKGGIYVDGLVLVNNSTGSPRRPRSLTEIEQNDAKAGVTRTLSVPNAHMRVHFADEDIDSSGRVRKSPKSNSKWKGGSKGSVSFSSNGFVNMGVDNGGSSPTEDHVYDTVPPEKDQPRDSSDAAVSWSKSGSKVSFKSDFDSRVSDSEDSPPTARKHGTLVPPKILQPRQPDVAVATETASTPSESDKEKEKEASVNDLVDVEEK